MKKIVQKSLVFLRCRLGIKRHPVGFDSNGNSYYDNGVMRKVVRSRSSSSLSDIKPPVVAYEYSKWLNYELDEFPDEDCNENKFPRHYFDKLSHDDMMVLKLCEKELDRTKAVYRPSLDSFLVIRFGEKPQLF